MLKKLTLAVMMACGAAFAQNVTAPATLDPGQIYNTGNIVQQTTTTSGSTWVNGVYQDQLTCFAWGNPGYCGPNPIVRPGNNINFSFGWTDLYQQQAIASVLPSSGTGLRVNGYNFGFMAKNGNGWDDGRTDLLFAYVQFNDPQGSSVLNHTHNLSYKFDWTAFNYNKTFDTPFAAKDLGTVRYGFVGRDNNGWAGPYGPEITNVSFGLNYSVDPCIKDPLYSPTCPGYMDALNKLLPLPVAVEPVATTSPVAATSAVAEVVIAPTTSLSTTPASQPSVVAPVVSAPAPVATSSSSSSGTATSSSTNNREVSGANTAQALSIIGRNQERDRETLSVAQSAVSAAVAAATSAQQEAVAVATAAVANSVNSNAVSGVGSTSSGPGFRSAAAANSASSQTSAFQLTSGMSAVSANSPQLQNMLSATTTSSSIAEAAPVTQLPPASTPNSGIATVETNVALVANFLTDRTSPINNVIEQRQTVPASTAATTGPSVNTRASDNEAAGGVTIATMAVAPQGYGDYLNFTLRDAAFYAPREVYRNQRTVDNARALRQLTNDGRHREMVEQQYKRN